MKPIHKHVTNAFLYAKLVMMPIHVLVVMIPIGKDHSANASLTIMNQGHNAYNV